MFANRYAKGFLRFKPENTDYECIGWHADFAGCDCCHFTPIPVAGMEVWRQQFLDTFGIEHNCICVGESCWSGSGSFEQAQLW